MTSYSTVYMHVGDREEVQNARIDGIPDNVKEALEWVSCLFPWVTFWVGDFPNPRTTYERHHWDDITTGDTP
jgi:hypothetical protein